MSGYCGGCGQAEAGCPGGCRSDLDPPRFCARCGRRLAVQVYPTSVVTRCPQGHDQSASAASPA